MKARYGSLAFALLFATGSAWADDDEPREDPWAYDQEKSEKREKADKEEKDEEEARSFGNSGDFAISAERIFGVSRTSWRIKQTGAADPKDSVTRVHLLVNENSDVLSYSAPRIAFDFFVMDGLSVGGALGYSAESASESDVSQHQTLVAPRVGYALMFSELIGVWPRVGITYQEQKTAARAEPLVAGGKVALLAASVEAELVLVPTANVLITLGPTLDFGLIGKFNPDGAGKKTDIGQDEFGFSAALGLYF